MTTLVRRQKFEAAIRLLQEFLNDKEVTNGPATVVSECIVLLNGILKGLKK